jgi:hypothetical protein
MRLSAQQAYKVARSGHGFWSYRHLNKKRLENNKRVLGMIKKYENL